MTTGGSNRFRIKYNCKNFNSLIVDLLYLEGSYVKFFLDFYLETVRFIGFPRSSNRGIFYFSAFVHDMIYARLT